MTLRCIAENCFVCRSNKILGRNNIMSQWHSNLHLDSKIYWLYLYLSPTENSYYCAKFSPVCHQMAYYFVCKVKYNPCWGQLPTQTHYPDTKFATTSCSCKCSIYANLYSITAAVCEVTLDTCRPIWHGFCSNLKLTFLHGIPSRSTGSILTMSGGYKTYLMSNASVT